MCGMCVRHPSDSSTYTHGALASQKEGSRLEKKDSRRIKNSVAKEEKEEDNK